MDKKTRKKLREEELKQSLRFQVMAYGLPAAVEEYRFDPVRMWRFDFAYPSQRIGIEIEGGVWIQGAHVRGAHFESDCEKYNAAAVALWHVLRFTPAMIEDGRAIVTIQSAMLVKGIRT
jgi:hypothetical protein